VEDGELVALVLQEPVVGAPRFELEAVRALHPVAAGEVALGDAVAEGDEPAGFVRSLRPGVLLERVADGLRYL
jgi:hypothetical protein